MPLATDTEPALPVKPGRHASAKPSLLKLGRQLHLYIGVFSAPALLFFAFSGALQTFSLHEAKKGSDYKPAHWLVVMGELHKNQTTQLPPRKPQPKQDATTSKLSPSAISKPVSAALASDVTATPPNGRTHHPLPLKIFFVVVSTGFFSSVLTGVFLCYRYNRNKTLVTAVLISGLIIPILLTLI